MSLIPGDLSLLNSRPANLGTINTLQGATLESYILNYSPEEIRQSKILWNTYAGRQDLSSSGVYTYNPDEMIYSRTVQGRNQYIPQANIKMDINRFANGIRNEIRAITGQMINGSISPQEWYNESIRMMKLSYRAAVDVSRGTDQPMTDEEKQRWLLLILALFLLLNGTAEGISNGSILINGRLPIVAGLRGAAISTLYENWRTAQANRLGYQEARRVLGIAEHCEDSEERPGCIELAALGWVPIRQLVPLGGATCHDNCKCTVEYRKKQRGLFQ